LAEGCFSASNEKYFASLKYNLGFKEPQKAYYEACLLILMWCLSQQ